MGFRACASPGKNDALRCPSCASCSFRHPSHARWQRSTRLLANAAASIAAPAAGGRAPRRRHRPHHSGQCPRGRPCGHAERNAWPLPSRKSVYTGESRRAAPAKIPKTAAIGVPPSGKPKLVAPPVSTGPDVITAAPSAWSPETVMPAHPNPDDPAQERIAQDAREGAAALARQVDQLEAARVEAAKRDADLRKETARVEAARAEATRGSCATRSATGGGPQSPLPGSRGARRGCASGGETRGGCATRARLEARPAGGARLEAGTHRSRATS